MCVFNFFIRKSWLAGESGEGDYLLRTRKLKVEFCGCSDTRRAFSRACIAKSAYHKPSLSRRMGAALPLRPCGSATRRRPSRRGPQRPWGAQGICGPAREAGFGRKGPNAGGKGILLFFRMNALISQMIGEYKCRSPFRDPRSSSRSEGPNALGFIKRIGLVRPEMALDRAPRGLTRRCRRRFSFFRCTALRAPCFHFFGTRRAYLFFVVWADFE